MKSLKKLVETFLSDTIKRRVHNTLSCYKYDAYVLSIKIRHS